MIDGDGEMNSVENATYHFGGLPRRRLQFL